MESTEKKRLIVILAIVLLFLVMIMFLSLCATSTIEAPQTSIVPLVQQQVQPEPVERVHIPQPEPVPQFKPIAIEIPDEALIEESPAAVTDAPPPAYGQQQVVEVVIQQPALQVETEPVEAVPASPIVDTEPVFPEASAEIEVPGEPVVPLEPAPSSMEKPDREAVPPSELVPAQVPKPLGEPVPSPDPVPLATLMPPLEVEVVSEPVSVQESVPDVMGKPSQQPEPAPLAIPQPFSITIEPYPEPELIPEVPVRQEIEPIRLPEPVTESTVITVESVIVEPEPEPLAVEPLSEPESAPIVVEAEPTAPTAELVEEADPWADFYVAGNEDLSLFETGGTYYVPLIVNSEYVGDIEIVFDSEDIFVNGAELYALVGTLLIPSLQDELFKDSPETVAISLLNTLGLETWYDYQRFELNMSIPATIMPLRFLSVTNTMPTRYGSYQMTGTKTLDPAAFSMFSNVSVYSSLDLSKDMLGNWKYDKSGLLNMQVSNSMSFKDVAVDFNYSAGLRGAYSDVLGWSTDFNDYFTFHGVQGFYDFVDKSLRFVFGNVNDYLGFSTDSFGFALEKRYSYGKVLPKGHQYQYEVLLDEPSTVEIFINEQSVYKRSLQAGTYRFKDFMFSQGANLARIVVTPDSNPEGFKEYWFDMGYDSRLMAKGDSLYSLSLTFDTSAYGMTDFLEDVATFDFVSIGTNLATSLGAFSARVFQQAGLTDSFTGSYDATIAPGGFHLGLSGILATAVGSFSGTFKTSLIKNLDPGFSFDLNHRISFSEESPITSVDTSLGYTTKDYTSNLNAGSGGSADSIAAALSLVGRLSKTVRLSLNGSLAWSFDNATPTWRITASSGYALLQNLSVSGSISVNSVVSGPAQVRGQIGVNYTFSPSLGFSLSSDLADANYLSASWKPAGGTHGSFQFSLSGIDWNDPLDHQGTMTYALNTKLLGMTVRQNYAQKFERFTTSVSLGTSFAYADGLLGISRSVADNFLLVKAGGELAKGGIAVTRTMSSQPDQLPSLFGTSAYTAISPHVKNNVVIYGTSDSAIGSSESFIYDFTPRPRQGYSLRISADATYTVVASLLQSDVKAYSRYTAPVAKVEKDESGAEYLIEDESLYLFTDENGFFLISGLKTGAYEISLYLPGSTEDDEPLRLRFFIEADPRDEDKRVLVLQNFNAERVAQELEDEEFARMAQELARFESGVLDYDGTYHLQVEQMLTEVQFWDEYYPRRLLRETVTVGTSDTSVVMIREPSLSALDKMREVRDARLQPLAQLSQALKVNLQLILPELAGQRPAATTQPYSTYTTQAP